MTASKTKLTEGTRKLTHPASVWAAAGTCLFFGLLYRNPLVHNLALGCFGNHLLQKYTTFIPVHGMNKQAEIIIPLKVWVHIPITHYFWNSWLQCTTHTPPPPKKKKLLKDGW